MNFRILFLIAMVALTIQGCQGSKGADKTARANNAAAGGGATGAPGSGQKPGADGVCNNPLSVTVQAGEKEIKLKELLDGKPGVYQLIAIEYFGSFQNGAGKPESLHFISTEIAADKNLKDEMSSQDKIELLCPAKETETLSMDLNADVDIPNDFDSYTGKSFNFRHDQVQIKKDGQKLLSSVYPKDLKLTDSALNAQKNWKIMLVQKDGGEITFKRQFDGALPNAKRARININTTYRLQK